MVQRFLCTDSVPAARLALVASGVIVLVQFAVFLLIGVGVFVFYRYAPPDEPFTGGDKAFVHFIVHHVPAGARGLIIAAVFAAAMSTLSSSLNSISSAVVTDLYRPLRPAAGEAHFLTVGRWLTLAAGGVQIGVAIFRQTLPEKSTVDGVLDIAGFTTGITLGVLVLGLVVRRAGGAAALSPCLPPPPWFRTFGSARSSTAGGTHWSDRARRSPLGRSRRS
jgi:Na+/proline symporter